MQTKLWIVELGVSENRNLVDDSSRAGPNAQLIEPPRQMRGDSGEVRATRSNLLRSLAPFIRLTSN